MVAAGLALAALAEPASSGRAAPDRRASRCLSVTVGELFANPGRYQGRRVCAHGFFGRIVPYGEAVLELYSSAADAEERRSDHYIDIEHAFTFMTQPALSRLSARPVVVSGTFSFRAICWTARAEDQPDASCWRRWPMSIERARIRRDTR